MKMEKEDIIQEAKKVDINADNLLDFMMEYECDDDMDIVRFVALVQYLVTTGMAWELQGLYGRIANDMIENGWCSR